MYNNFTAKCHNYVTGELIFDFQVITTNADTYIIKRGTDGDLLYGCVFCMSDTENKCVAATSANDTLI